MNILFVAAESNLYSGALRSMVRLIQLLTERYGHHCLVVLPREGDGQKLLDEEGIRYAIIPSDNGVIPSQRKNDILLRVKKECLALRTWLHVRDMIDLIRNEKIDLVHINATDAFIGAYSARKVGIPYVWHIREFLEEDHGCEFIHPNMYYSLMRDSKQMIAISHSIEKKYEPVVGSDKITTIFNGIDASSYLNEKHDIFSGLLGEKAFVKLLMVGRLEESKGHLLAIEACAKLHDEIHIPFILNIVGTGNSEYMERIRKKIEEHRAEEYVKMCGRSDNTAMYYGSSDIFLMCSKAEAFGRVTVEAMMSGCLVIGNRTAGTKELIKDGVTGLLYEDGNVEELADKISYAIHHPAEAREMASKGRTYMNENMTAELNAEKVNNLYQKIIGGGNC